MKRIRRFLSSSKALAIFTRLDERGAMPSSARVRWPSPQKFGVGAGFRADQEDTVRADATSDGFMLHGRVHRAGALFVPGAVVATGPWGARPGTTEARTDRGPLLLRVAEGAVQVVQTPPQPAEWVDLDGVVV